MPTVRKKRTQQATGSAPSTPKFIFDSWRQLIDSEGVSALEGHTLNISTFEDLLPKAVAQGLVTQPDAEFIISGITSGFSLDIDETKMGKAKIYKNYSSALDNAELITSALSKRVKGGKTLKLGNWWKGASLPTGSEKGCNVPQGGVPKKLERDVIRPISDHTKTLLNSAVDLSRVAHTLDTYNEIATELKTGYSMRVEDIDGAFPILPLATSVWKYMYVIWYDVDRPLSEQTEPNTLYVHTFGDFGTCAMPGVWDKFWRCIKAMATVAGVLKSPMPHFVDDNSLIGPDPSSINKEAEDLGVWLKSYVGISFKDLKSRVAATRQLVLGFWWDSIERTRTLESEKLQLYLDHLRVAQKSTHLSLHDMQVLSGRMQRAALTMPPRAIVYLSSIFQLMRGLTMPWHKRRVNAVLRKDLGMLITVLEENKGRGYFCFDHFSVAPTVYTDAAKERRHVGGGFFSECGRYDFWKYGSASGRNSINYLEGDAVVRAAKSLGHLWKNKIVPLRIDNSAFQLSLKRGISKSPKLCELLRQLFVLSVKYECVFQPTWISTHDNIAADALSRGDLDRFFQFTREQHGGSIDLRRVG